MTSGKATQIVVMRAVTSAVMALRYGFDHGHGHEATPGPPRPGVASAPAKVPNPGLVEMIRFANAQDGRFALMNVFASLMAIAKPTPTLPVLPELPVAIALSMPMTSPAMLKSAPPESP